MARNSTATAAALPRMMAFVREDLGEALAAMQAPASKGRVKAPKKAAKWVPSLGLRGTRGGRLGGRRAGPRTRRLTSP